MTATHWYAPFKAEYSPVVAAPDGEPLLCVSFHRGYLPFILGALASMLQPEMWRGTPAEKAVAVQKAHNLLYRFALAGECSTEVIRPEDYEVMASLCESLRWHNGKLQALCCGDWTDIPGQLPGGNGEQPGEGAPQPPIGGCQSYHIHVSATMQSFPPTTVNTGDTLTFSNPRGTASDGSSSGLLYCPSGNLFFLGSCVGFYGSLPGDPMPTAPHMAVIAQIGGVWYDTGGPITVGAGVVNLPVLFQVNDATLSDNAGGYDFDVEICNNATPDWTSVLDFRISTFGTTVPSGEAGIWVPGQGWRVSCLQQSGVSGGGASYMYAKVKLPFTEAEITQVKYNAEGVVLGTFDPSTLNSDIFTLNPGQTNLITDVATAGDYELVWDGDANFDDMGVTLMVGYHSEDTGPTPDCPGGDGYIRTMTISGKAPKPPELP